MTYLDNAECIWTVPFEHPAGPDNDQGVRSEGGMSRRVDKDEIKKERNKILKNLCVRDEVGVQMRHGPDHGRPNPLIYVLLKLTLKTYDGSGQKAIYFCN